jgi:hypothetical protein
LFYHDFPYLEFPKFVVKYFKVEDKVHFERGSFRFGSLNYYRNVEERAEGSENLGGQRFKDRHEGIDIVHIDRAFGGPELQDRTGIQLSESDFIVNLGLQKSFRSNVFCCSVGDYDWAHHVTLLHGRLLPDGQIYEAQRELQCYCVIDVYQFMRAVDWTVNNDVKYRYLKPLSENGSREIQVQAGYVHYDKSISYYKTLNDPSFSRLTAEQRCHNATYRKPHFFSVEREFRIVLGNERRDLNIDSIDICSEKLKSSILRFGRLH